MGRVGETLEVIPTTRNGEEFTEIKTDPNDTSTDELFQPAGFCATPLRKEGDATRDITISVTIDGSDRSVVVGFIDILNRAISEAGETGMYSRDGEGAIQLTAVVRSGGTFDISKEIDPDTGLPVDPDDFGSVASKVNARCKRLEDKLDSHIGVFNGHEHDYVGAGDNSTPQVTAPPSDDSLLGEGDDVASQIVRIPSD